jgi:hypothetical protein
MFQARTLRSRLRANSDPVVGSSAPAAKHFCDDFWSMVVVPLCSVPRDG